MGICKFTVKEVKNVNELCDRIARATECVTNQMLPIPG